MNKTHDLRRPVLFFALFFALFCLLSIPAAADKSLTSLALSYGNHQISGHGDDLFNIPFQEACVEDSSETIATRPAAGSAGKTMTLTSKWNPCGSDEPAPQLDCAVEIKPQSLDGPDCRCAQDDADCSTPPSTKHQVSLSGWEASADFPMPERLGAYTLNLTCSADGKTLKTFEGPLYVLHKDPMEWMQPAEELWYRRNACWTEGLDAAVTEPDVLQAVLKGFYRFGNHNLLYGYASAKDFDPKSDNAMVFQTAAKNNKTVTLDANLINQDVGPFTCTWQALLQDPPICNWADCYVFSRVLQSMAGLQGVGGLIPRQILGADLSGFMTRPGSQSLDLKFKGNVQCDDVEVCMPYMFGSHSLRQRDGLVYDQTFGEIHQTLDGGVGADLTWWHYAQGKGEGYGGLSTTRMMLKQIPSTYGDWFFVSLQPNDLKRVAPEADDDDSDRIVWKNATIKASKPTADGFSKQLKATVQIDVKVPGAYVFHSALCREGSNASGVKGLCGGSNGQVTCRSSFNASENVASARRFTKTGPATVELSFSGEDIRHSGVEGPWSVRVGVLSEDSKPASSSIGSFETPALKTDQFSELPLQATFPNKPKLDPDNTPPKFLYVDFELDILTAGEYAFEIRSAKGLRTTGYSSLVAVIDDQEELQSPIRGKHQFTAGKKTVRAYFNLEPGKPLQGKYHLSIIVFDEKRNAVAAFATDPIDIPEKGAE